MLKFLCPTCGARLSVPESAAGESVRCVRCRNIFPVASGRPAPPRSGPHVEPPPEPREELRVEHRAAPPPEPRGSVAPVGTAVLRPEPRAEPRVEPRPAPRPEARVESRAAPRPEPRVPVARVYAVAPRPARRWFSARRAVSIALVALVLILGGGLGYWLSRDTAKPVVAAGGGGAGTSRSSSASDDHGYSGSGYESGGADERGFSGPPASAPVPANRVGAAPGVSAETAGSPARAAAGGGGESSVPEVPGAPSAGFTVGETAPPPASALAFVPLRPAPPTEEELRAEAEARAQSVKGALEQIKLELVADGGGTWENWAKRLEPFRTDARQRRREAPPDGFAFLGSSVLWLDQLPAGPESACDSILAFDKQLKTRGIDLIVMPIPDKEMVFPDKLSDLAPADRLVALAMKRLMADLLEHDVEVLDLFTFFRDYRAKTQDKEWLYQRADTHWHNLGARLAAGEIAARLRRYGFVRDALARRSLFTTSEGVQPGSCDVGDKAKVAADRSYDDRYVSVLRANGSVYVDVPDAPIIVTADSFGRKNRELGAHTSAQVAFRINMPVTLLSAMGSGPQIPQMVAEEGRDYLAGRRVFIWTGVSRQFNAKWTTAKLP